MPQNVAGASMTAVDTEKFDPRGALAIAVGQLEQRHQTFPKLTRSLGFGASTGWRSVQDVERSPCASRHRSSVMLKQASGTNHGPPKHLDSV